MPSQEWILMGKLVNQIYTKPDAGLLLALTSRESFTLAYESKAYLKCKTVYLSFETILSTPALLSSVSNTKKELTRNFELFNTQLCFRCLIVQPEPFREPVDWKGLGLYDYPQIVKKPMDLGQIKRKIEKEQYSSLHEAAEDVRLVWANCKTYNADGSDFFLLAENHSKKFEEKFSKLLKELNIPENPEESTYHEPTLDEKKLFAKRLYKITKEELGKVIIDLDDMCPSAITKNSAEDQLEINVDNISPAAFKKVMEFVTECAADSSGKKKKSVPPNNKNKKSKTS